MSSITEVDADQRQKWLQSKENTNRLEFCLGVHECTSPPVRERKVRRPKAPLSPLQKKNWRRRHAESRCLAAKTVLSPPTLRGESREARKEASSTVRFQTVQNIPQTECHGETVQQHQSDARPTQRTAAIFSAKAAEASAPKKSVAKSLMRKKNRNPHLRIDRRVWSARPLVQQTNKDRVAAV